MFTGNSMEAAALLAGEKFHGRLPRFDIGMASTVEEIDGIIRPDVKNENSLVRPRGGILFRGTGGTNPLLSFIACGRRLRTSRCGEFRPAIDFLVDNPALADTITKNLITHEAYAADLPRAYARAKDRDMLKILIYHESW